MDRKVFCAKCGYSFSVASGEATSQCPSCAAVVHIEDGRKTVRVSGKVAAEVEKVSRSLVYPSETKMPDSVGDYVALFVSRAKSYRIIALLICISIVVIGVGQFTDAIGKIHEFMSGFKLANSLADLPGETGWIFAGYFNTETGEFIEGPWVSVVRPKRLGMHRYIDIGDEISLNVKRKVFILDFKTKSADRKLESPIVAGSVGKGDETGLVLPAQTELLVRDVSEGKWPENPSAALWLRVVDKPL